MIKIALVQAAAGENLAAGLGTVRRYAEAAAQAGCQAVCFPECFLTGYVPEEAAARSIPAEDPALRQLSVLAAEQKLDILVGFMERSEQSFYITHGLFRADGVQALYRKTHLGRREQSFFSAGEQLKVMSLTDGTRIGIALCVETHYPQILQTLALRGAQVIFAPHAVPRVSGDRQKIWGKYIPARSYDNRVYVACCNLWDAARFGGGCLVTDPRGETVAAVFREEEAMLTCMLDRELVASFRDPAHKRSRHYYPALRKPGLYD